MNRYNSWFTVGILFAIALAATVSALALQELFGRSLSWVLVGPLIAVAAVLIYLLFFNRRRK